jgi:hypothetical protein
LPACGDATVALTLDPTQPVTVTSRSESLALASLAITVEQSDEFCDALRARKAPAGTEISS